MKQTSAVWASRAWAASALGFACGYYTGGWSPYTGWFLYPAGLLLIVPVIVGVRVAVAGRWSNDTASMALDVMAFGLVGAPVLVVLPYILTLPWAHGPGSGVTDNCLFREGWTGGTLEALWPVSAAGALFVVGCALRRRGSLARLRWWQAVGTVLAMLAVAPLALLVGLGSLMDVGHLRGVALVFCPALLATGGTVVTWVKGRPVPPARTVRRVAIVAMVLGVSFGTVLGGNREDGCLTSWNLVSLAGPGWLWLAFAGILLFVRDPQGAAAPGTPQPSTGVDPTLSDPGPEGSLAMGARARGSAPDAPTMGGAQHERMRRELGRGVDCLFTSGRRSVNSGLICGSMLGIPAGWYCCHAFPNGWGIAAPLVFLAGPLLGAVVSFHLGAAVGLYRAGYRWALLLAPALTAAIVWLPCRLYTGGKWQKEEYRRLILQMQSDDPSPFLARLHDTRSRAIVREHLEQFLVCAGRSPRSEFIDAVATLDPRGKEGFALCAAAEYGQPATISHLLDEGYLPTRGHRLNGALCDPLAELVEASRATEPCFPSMSGDFDQFGGTPTALGCKNRAEVAELLLEAGAPAPAQGAFKVPGCTDDGQRDAGDESAE